MSAKVLFEEYPAIYTREVACDGISPPLDCSHVAFTAKFSDFLCRLLDSQGKPNVFYHFKGYSETEVVFTFHDAFDGELAVSSAVSENAVREFGTALGCQPQLTRFPVDMYQQLVAIDRAMNPPWWKKLLGIGLVVAKD